MTDLTAAAQIQALEGRLQEILCRDAAELHELMIRALRRVHRNQPVDRILDSLEARLVRAEARAETFRADLPVPKYRDDLPIHRDREKIIEAMRQHPVLVVCGETGSGKTTQLPKLCLEAGSGRRGLIGHTQPRRIAARSVAQRIAEELGTELGAVVGFKVRFNDRSGPQTRLRLMTDGILLAELRQDPQLLAYDTLIIDEAHERSLNIDFLLGYLKRLRSSRPELRIVVTSATLDPKRISDFFDQAPVLEIPGRSWPVEVRYRHPENSDAPEEEDPDEEDPEEEDPDPSAAIAEAVLECAQTGPGDILIFLPGEREIRDAAERLRRTPELVAEILPLYARLSTAEQARVFQPHSGRRIVLATNVAETALTVPGIRFVIDSGLARVSRYSWRSRIQRLQLEAISRASADQRAGRCGRLGPGICIRLYSEDDFATRPAFAEPEILRSNLASVILQMLELGLGDPRHFPFIDAPDARLIRDGFRLLEELEAVDNRGHLTARGRQLAQLPIDPRLGAILLTAHKKGIDHAGTTVVAFLAIQDPRERPAAQSAAADAAQAAFRVAGSDFLGILRLWEGWHAAREELGSKGLRRWCRDHFLAFTRMREWQDLRSQLLTLSREFGMGTEQGSQQDPAAQNPAGRSDSARPLTRDVPAGGAQTTRKPSPERSREPARAERQDDLANSLHQSILAGFATQIGRKSERGDYLGPRNRRMHIHPSSVLARQRPQWIVAAEIAETTRVWARTVATIAPEWIIQIAPHLLRHEIHAPYFQERDGRIGARDRISLHGLVIAAEAPVNFARHDPTGAREILIREGLVAGRLRSRSRGYNENRQLVASVTEMESRGRRRDLLAEEEVLRDFYEARIPAAVVDGPSFEAWARKTEADNPDILRITLDTLVREDAGLPSKDAFPDRLFHAGHEWPLTYQFEPGREDDGVTVTIPLVAVRGLPDHFGDWLVPGLLEERVIALLRSLPKALRKSFVPAPEFARAALARLENREGDLGEHLARVLTEITGVFIPRDSWRSDRLEPHLRMRFRILNDTGGEIASGRDFAALRNQLEPQASDAFAAVEPERFARAEITQWDFGALPESIQIEHHGATLRAYPILVDAGQSVSLRAELDPDQAQRLHRAGLCRLFLLASRKRVRDVERQLPGIDAACLQYAPLGSCTELRDLILRTAAIEVFLRERPWPDDATAFLARLERVGSELAPAAMRLGQLTSEVLRRLHAIRQRLARALPLSWIEAAKDIEDQLSVLIPADFLLVTPETYRSQLPRYLDAIAHRLERLDRNPERDRHLRVEIEPLWNAIKELWLDNPDSGEIQSLRFRCEELRVSLFAQPLGTREKVSVPRLARELSLTRGEISR